jgi:hypothetical protein
MIGAQSAFLRAVAGCYGPALAAELRAAFRIGRMPAVWARLAGYGDPGMVLALRTIYRALVADQNRTQKARMDARIQERRRGLLPQQK